MSFATVNPASGERLAAFPLMSAETVERVIAEAHRAQQDWARLTFAERAVPMLKAAALLTERTPELARLIALEMGKPLREGTAELAKCASACEYFAAHAKDLLTSRDESSEVSNRYVRFDPLGVILAIMPWNFPFWQVFRFIAPHLMAGNGGLLKHAPNVPQCASAIEALLREAGFPLGLFANLVIDTDVIPTVIADPRIAAVTITGSERAGRAVAEAAGRALKPVVLELGGSDAFIVLADADLDAAAKAAAIARTMNAGQSCICAKRFIVESAIYERFLGLLSEAMRGIQIGDPFNPATGIGPLARHDLRAGLHAQVAEAITHGARLVLGGRIPEGLGAFYPPTILADVELGNPAAREELFGPVATVMRASNPEHAVIIANSTRFGLGASIWSGNRKRAELMAARIEAGSVFINGIVKTDPQLPFGGIKSSGFGRELGLEGIRAFVNAKTVWIS